MTTSRSRHDGQPAFVLHSYPFRETSLIIEAFACESGRVALVARGARRPRSALRGVLRAFQPLLLTWSGRGELRTLHKAEWHGAYMALSGLPLICGFYLNELLLKFLARDDPHERLFAVYQETLDALAGGGESAGILRRFEKHLLRELGYGLILDRDADSGAPIAAEARYTYVVDRGPIVQPGDAAGLGVELTGQTLIDMQSDNYATVETLQQSKALMRALINHYLGDRTLHTRQLLRDLRAL
ncbi:MAG TPA: DNA repair protein RecO [Burkholderiales bacterium]|jgi:DNA repair protein RecO (recombination protein O)|nr:DNA repair protein RecO [Burkholderiales bacterium]